MGGTLYQKNVRGDSETVQARDAPMKALNDARYRRNSFEDKSTSLGEAMTQGGAEPLQSISIYEQYLLSGSLRAAVTNLWWEERVVDERKPS